MHVLHAVGKTERHLTITGGRSKVKSNINIHIYSHVWQIAMCTNIAKNVKKVNRYL